MIAWCWVDIGGFRREVTKEHVETFQVDEYVHYLDCGHGSELCRYVKTSQVVHFKCI